MDRLLAAPLFLRRLTPLLAAGKLEFKPRNWRKTMEFTMKEIYEYATVMSPLR